MTSPENLSPDDERRAILVPWSGRENFSELVGILEAAEAMPPTIDVLTGGLLLNPETAAEIMSRIPDVEDVTPVRHADMATQEGARIFLQNTKAREAFVVDFGRKSLSLTSLLSNTFETRHVTESWHVFAMTEQSPGWERVPERVVYEDVKAAVDAFRAEIA